MEASDSGNNTPRGNASRESLSSELDNGRESNAINQAGKKGGSMQSASPLRPAQPGGEGAYQSQLNPKVGRSVPVVVV